MGEEGKHARFRLSTGSLSARGVAFNANGKLEAAQRSPHDIAVRLEINHWNGAVEPRAVLADAFARQSPDGVEGDPGGHSCAERDADHWWRRYAEELGRDPAGGAVPTVPAAAAATGADRRILDARRGSGGARIAELLSSGERVMVVAADAGRRAGLTEPGAIGGAERPACVCLRCPGGELEARGRRSRPQSRRHRLEHPGGGARSRPRLPAPGPRRPAERGGSRPGRARRDRRRLCTSLLGAGGRARRALLGRGMAAPRPAG